MSSGEQVLVTSRILLAMQEVATSVQVFGSKFSGLHNVGNVVSRVLMPAGMPAKPRLRLLYTPQRNTRLTQFQRQSVHARAIDAAVASLALSPTGGAEFVSRGCALLDPEVTSTRFMHASKLRTDSSHSLSIALIDFACANAQG